MNQTKNEGYFQAMSLLHHEVSDLFQDHWIKLYHFSEGNHRHHLWPQILQIHGGRPQITQIYGGTKSILSWPK